MIFKFLAGKEIIMKQAVTFRCNDDERVRKNRLQLTFIGFFAITRYAFGVMLQ